MIYLIHTESITYELVNLLHLVLACEKTENYSSW